MSRAARSLSFALLLLVGGLYGCEKLPSVPEGSTPNQEQYPAVADRVQELFGNQVTSFQLRQLDVGQLSEGLDQGDVEIPVANEENEIQQVQLNARAVQLRAPDLEQGVLRSGATTDPGVERVSLPPEQNYVLGACEGGEAPRCGGVTVLDDARTMLGGVVMHPNVGTTFVQPVGVLLDELPEGTPEGLHVLYHQANTQPVSYPAGEGLVEEASSSATSDETPVALDHGATGKKTGVVLDGDVQFYQQDTATVWRRQELNMLMARLTYAYLEPNSGSTHGWGLDLQIKGQEVWVRGGPDTTNARALVEDVLEDPNYFTIHDVDADEMLVFYVGYEVGHSGYFGRAGGIPGAGSWNSKEFGGGTRNNRAWVKDMPRLSLNTVWGVSMHEIGHLVGGLHGDGCSSCSSGSWSGTSIMPAGKATLDNRDPFFSDANDARIGTILNNVLP